MCCKMLMNLVDCIRQRNGEDVPNLKCTQGETVSFDLLIRILQVYVLKLKVVSKLYIPAIISKKYVYLLKNIKLLYIFNINCDLTF